MKVLGYPATWPTTCFILGGCGDRGPLFAHTNGFGDFVLFDELGPPWPVHHCYAERFLRSYSSARSDFSIREDRIDQYRSTEDPAFNLTIPPRASDIRRVEPESLLGQKPVPITGYVQEYIELRADYLLRPLASLVRTHLEKILGRRKSQITIVTSELQSYTIFADLSNVVVRKKDMIMASIRAVGCIGIPKRSAVLVADRVLLIHSPSS